MASSLHPTCASPDACTRILIVDDSAVARALIARQIEHEEGGRCHVVHVEELTPRHACAPDHNFVAALLCSFMEPANQSRKHMAVLGMEIVARPVKVGRHDRAVVGAMLAIIALAQLDSGNLGDGVRLVGGFKHPGQQRTFCNRLRRFLRINAG